MNFAVPFVRQFNFLNQENVEFNINFKNNIEKLDNFVKNYGSHKINLLVPELKSIDEYSECFQTIALLRERNPESKIYTVLFKYDKQLEQKINTLQLPHYYSEIISSWDRFQGFLTLNVTDIFITGEIAFNIKLAKENADKNKKRLRCYCNIVQSNWREGPSLKSFFIRPEDIELYKDYIDCIEFFIADIQDAKRINLLYEVYVKNQFWFGKLNEIISGYQGEQDSRFIIAKFGEQRLNCGNRCMTGALHSCKICDRIIELGNTLKEQDLIVMIDK